MTQVQILYRYIVPSSSSFAVGSLTTRLSRQILKFIWIFMPTLFNDKFVLFHFSESTTIK